MQEDSLLLSYLGGQDGENKVTRERSGRFSFPLDLGHWVTRLSLMLTSSFEL